MSYSVHHLNRDTLVTRTWTSNGCWNGWNRRSEPFSPEECPYSDHSFPESCIVVRSQSAYFFVLFLARFEVVASMLLDSDGGIYSSSDFICRKVLWWWSFKHIFIWRMLVLHCVRLPLFDAIGCIGRFKMQCWCWIHSCTLRRSFFSSTREKCGQGWIRSCTLSTSFFTGARC